MCSVWWHLALGPTPFLGRERRTVHTLSEAEREAIVAFG